ncbi:hypothetical protein EJ06DRAFT_316354 [Trichodelitschia bisporula]|uniref:Uncharacterized protein n=1 Tax=Trichodelitschia bisporula TaxID=703511 RepID=A0A6G1I484_9PEZI|nr:hypothetical protein EJ06DRAFT_316354 [Trichodelitschia bisporula]
MGEGVMLFVNGDFSALVATSMCPCELHDHNPAIKSQPQHAYGHIFRHSVSSIPNHQRPSLLPRSRPPCLTGHICIPTPRIHHYASPQTRIHGTNSFHRHIPSSRSSPALPCIHSMHYFNASRRFDLTSACRTRTADSARTLNRSARKHAQTSALR